MSNVKEVHGKPRLHVPVNLLGTLRSEDEDDYEYEFSVLSSRTSKNVGLVVGLQTLCACSVRKTRTGTRHSRPTSFLGPFPYLECGALKIGKGPGNEVDSRPQTTSFPGSLM